MFKRLFWFSSGAATGAAGSWWIRRRIQERLRRYTPAGMRDQALRRAKQARADARTALAEGRRLARTARDGAAADARVTDGRYRTNGQATSPRR